MKYSILGFKQEKLMELVEQGANLDVVDLVIMKWVADLSSRSSAVKKLIDGTTYVWVKYDTLLADIPFLGIKKRALQTRIENLINIGLLSHFHDKEKGSYAYYALTENYECLIYDNGGYAKFCIGGMHQNAQQRLINNKKPIDSVLDREKDFCRKVREFSCKYPSDMIENFIRCWTEKNPAGTKMRFEMQETFEIGRRLATWASKSWNKPSQPQEAHPKTPWEKLGITKEEFYEG